MPQPGQIFRRSMLYLLMALCLAPALRAQQSIPYSGRYDESLSNAKMAGGLLLGVRAGTDTGKFEPRAVGLYVTAALIGKSVCVDIHSRDARYSARNTYQIPPGMAGKMGYFAVDTSFEKLLDGYESRDMAVLIHTEACSGKPGKTILPAVLGRTALTGETPTRQITVSVNEDPALLTVLLKANGGVMSPKASCSGETRILASAYLANCTVAVPGAGGPYALQVNVEGAFSSTLTTFAVAVPGP